MRRIDRDPSPAESPLHIRPNGLARDTVTLEVRRNRVDDQLDSGECSERGSANRDEHLCIRVSNADGDQKERHAEYAKRLECGHRVPSKVIGSDVCA